MLSHFFTSLTVLTFAALSANAQVTGIFLPGFDPQPISMTEVGAGSDGKTTYLLGAGSQTNTNEEVGIPTSASLTYIVGPSDVAWHMAIGDQSASIGCQIGSDKLATCVEGGGDTPPFTTVEPFNTAFPVQFAAPTVSPGGGASSTGAAAGTSQTGATDTQKSTPAGPTSNGASNTASNPSPSSTSGAGLVTSASVGVLGMLVLGVTTLF